MTIADITATIRKDEFIRSKPWHADLLVTEIGSDEPQRIKSWLQFFTTKKALVAGIRAAEPNATIIDTNGEAV